MLSMAVVAMSVTAAVGAQSTKAKGKGPKPDTMRMTYTGCVQSINHGGTFMLTNVDNMGATSMHGDATMAHDDQMPIHADAARTAAHDATAVTGEEMDTMPSKSFILAGSGNLSRHVGQKVSITGSLSDGAMRTMRRDVSTLTVKTLKVVAKSCS